MSERSERPKDPAERSERPKDPAERSERPEDPAQHDERATNQTSGDTEPRWLNEIEMRAWTGFVRTRDLIAAAVGRDSTRDSNLTYVEHHVLACLSDAEGHLMSFAELAATLEWSQSRLSHQITRMEKRGLVRREAIPDDARRTSAVLTPKGYQVVADAAPQHVDSVRRHLVDVLSHDQIAALADIYDTLLTHHRRLGTEQS